MRTFTISIDPFPGTLARWRVMGQLHDPRLAPRQAEDPVEYVFTRARDQGRGWDPNPELLDLEDRPREYGTALGQRVFGVNVGELFRQAVEQSPERLHVILVLRDPSLEALAWQRLCYPQGDGTWEHLRLTRNLPFAIRVTVPGVDLEVPLLKRNEFRALIVAADPPPGNRYSLAPFDAASVVRGLRRALGRIPCKVLANVEDADGPPTMQTLREYLGRERSSWLHVVCHGETGEETVIYLLDEKSQVAWVKAGELIAEIRRQRTEQGLPHFAFLCACETAQPQTGEAVGDLGRRLVREAGLSAVVAMTETIPIATATALSERFYYHLAFHGTVDLAINAASAELAESQGITVPTLLSRLDGRSLCLESEFLDFEQVRLVWRRWLEGHKVRRLLSPRETVESPLSSDWADFLAGESFQRRIEDLVEEIASPLPSDEFALALISQSEEMGGIPDWGENLVVVADVDHVLHFRIFDDGHMVVDTDETRLTEQARPIEDLKKQLEDLWPPQEMTESDKVRVITAVTSIVAQALSDTNPEWFEAVRELEEFVLDRPCEKVVSDIFPLVNSCLRIRRAPRKKKNLLKELQDVIKARSFRCCFPVVGQFGSGKSFFIDDVINSSTVEADSRLLVLPITPSPPRRLEEEILASACEAARGLRSWETLEDLDRDLEWHGATLVVVIEDLHLYLDRPTPAGGTGLTHAAVEEAMAGVSRFPSIKWLFTLQDTCFHKVAFHSRFWEQYGQPIDRREFSKVAERYHRGREERKAAERVEARQNQRDFLLGWATLNDRNERDTIGLQILDKNLPGEHTSMRLVEQAAQPGNEVSSLWRLLSVPLFAAVLTSEFERSEEATTVSVNRESLVKELLGEFYARHGGEDLRPSINEGFMMLSRLFSEGEGGPTLELANRSLQPLGGKADAVLAKLVDFGLLGMTPKDVTSTPATTPLEYRFEPVWHFFLAHALFDGRDLPLDSPEALLRELVERLKKIVEPDHREGVGEFALTLILGRLKGLADDPSRPPLFAAGFAAHPALPNVSAFRAACYEPPDFQESFSQACLKTLAGKLPPRTLFGLLQFVDSAWETPLTSGVAFISGRYEECRTVGYADYCGAVLVRRIGHCQDQEALWRSLDQLAGCEELGERPFGRFESSHAYQVARSVIDQLRGDLALSSEEALGRLLDHLETQQTRARLDHERYELQRRPRSPYFFRECLLYHFCDWYLEENGLDSWEQLDEHEWYHQREREVRRSRRS